MIKIFLWVFPVLALMVIEAYINYRLNYKKDHKIRNSGHPDKYYEEKEK